MGKVSQASGAYVRLRAKIERGEFTNGERMTEARVSEMLGVGRGPARESLLRLESDGLLRRRGPHRTRYVEYLEEQTHEGLAAQYELREVIDGLAARCAALNMTGRQVIALRKIFSRITESIKTNDGKGRVDALAEFYEMLRSKCGNPLVMKTCESCSIATYYVLTNELEEKLLAQMPYVNPSVPSLASVVEAIASHNPEAAESEMRAWTRNIGRIVCESENDTHEKPKG